MTDRERVEALLRDASLLSHGVVRDLSNALRALLRERDAAEALAYERAAEVADSHFAYIDPEDAEPIGDHYDEVAHGYANASDNIRIAIRDLATSPNALAEHDAKVRAEAEAPLLELLRWVHETLWEINPSNYDHDDVCKLNAASVEVILGIAPMLGETHGKSPEWWAAREQVSD